MFEERKSVKEIIGNVVLALLFGVVFTVVLIEWMAGCGETTWINAHPEVQNECVFMTWNNK